MNRLRVWWWFLWHTGEYSKWRPKRTGWMKARGTVWKYKNGTWWIVCDYCGSNCGQCGLTGDVGPGYIN